METSKEKQEQMNPAIPMSHVDQDAVEARDRLLDQDQLTMTLSDWVQVDAARNREKQDPVWPYEFEYPKIGTRILVGDAVAVVCSYGLKRTPNGFERCVWAKSNSGGTLRKVTGDMMRPASTDDVKKAEKKQAEFKKKLTEAAKKIEAETVEKREIRSGGSLSLVTPMLDIAKQMGLNVDEKSGFYKITGTQKGRSVYLARRGGRVDISGFTVIDVEGVTVISEEEAKRRHIGKVRGQMLFDGSNQSLVDSFRIVLERMVNG
jgi:hypothetical protein